MADAQRPVIVDHGERLEGGHLAQTESIAAVTSSAVGPSPQQPCPLCHRQVRPRRYLAGGVLACPLCSVAWTNPPPAIVHDDYVEDRVNAAEGYTADEKLFRSFPAQLVRFVRTVNGPGAGRAALDVGCNIGYCVDALNHVGYAAEGVEPNEVAVRIARASGLNVHLGVLDGTFP